MIDQFVSEVNLALTTIGFEHELSSQYVKKVYRAVIAQKILDYSAEHKQCSNEIMCQIAKSFITDENVRRHTLNRLMIELQKVSTNPDIQKYEQRITRGGRQPKPIIVQSGKKPIIVQSGKSDPHEMYKSTEFFFHEAELRKKILTTLIEHDYWNWTFNTETNKLEIQF